MVLLLEEPTFYSIPAIFKTVSDLLSIVVDVSNASNSSYYS